MSRWRDGKMERHKILSKLERVWDLNPDKSFCGLLDHVADLEDWQRISDTEDGYLLERLDAIIDEHEHGECP